MSADLAAEVEAIRGAVLSAQGALDTATREAVMRGRPLEGPLSAYVDKVRQHAYRVTDEDLATLRRSGLSEDMIFEVTVAAALGAGLVRLRVGLAALQAPGDGR